jgi:hypothetical protein
METKDAVITVNENEDSQSRRGRPSKGIRMEFFVGKDFMRRFRFDNPDARRKDTVVYHAYPTLAHWIGRTLPDNVNPRSHEGESLRSPVAREIEKTILERPEEFVRANRGITIIAEQVDFDEKSGKMAIVISKPDIQGVADGGTTDAVIARIQKQLLENKSISEVPQEEMPEQLKLARVHLEICVGLTDREQISPLVAGRNTSRQVKPWTLADFEGRFEWLKTDVFNKDSKFADKIGYEENAQTELSVLDVLSFLTLFHPQYDEVIDGEDTPAPVIAYSGKGRLDQRLRDPETEKGYKALAPVVEPILELYEYIYATFDTQYVKAYGKGARLGRKHSVRPMPDKQPLVLPLTGFNSQYRIPAGYLFPILAGFRALLGYHRDGTAFFRVDPKGFWDEHGSKLVKVLMNQADEVGGNPNRLGKTPTAYSALYDRTKLLFMEAKK